MPVVTITLMEGYAAEVRTRMAERLTDAVRATIAAPLDGITVIINEVAAPVGYMRGRTERIPGAPLPSPIDVVRAHLEAMERRDFAAAAAMLADDFTMTFPGGNRFRTLEELASWASRRYRRIAKDYEGFDEVPGEAGVAVYCFGTLEGEWTDGTAFEGVRFIDRFTVKDGTLIDQRVWNDLGEVMRANAAGAQASA